MIEGLHVIWRSFTSILFHLDTNTAARRPPAAHLNK